MNDNANIATGGDIDPHAIVMDPRDLPADHPDANLARTLYVKRGVSSVQHGETPPAPSAEFIAAQSPAIIIKQVEDRVSKLEQQLAASAGFDPVTGAPVPLLKDRVRENATRELAQLKHSTLPFARIQAAEIARAQAALPTQEDKLREEAAKRDRIQARALELADEAAAKELAERIKTQRRAQSMGG